MPEPTGSSSAGRATRPVRANASRPDPFLRSIVGASARMRRIFKLVSKIAPTDSTVLLLGESGTGKELIARAIHLQSRRAEGPFVPVNMAALPEALIESELFGHQRGAFTGAHGERRGLVEGADGGTLFLDEIGDMPLASQVNLLRTLESGEVRRLGENTARVVDVRVIAATHHDLLADVETGRFRRDLYYRINVVQIELPPLRERREDIGLLASFFLDRCAARAGRAGLHFTPEAAALLERYDFPGNVRELENAIEHAVAVADGAAIGPADLPMALSAQRQIEARYADVGSTETGSEVAACDVREKPRESWSLAEIEKEHIERVLKFHRGNTTSAAAQLGISRTTLWRKLRAYSLKRRPG